MKVDTKEVNPAFQSIIQNPGQKVFLDANFFIPPDRSEVAKIRAYSFTDFKECWLIPLLSEFAEITEMFITGTIEEKENYNERT